MQLISLRRLDSSETRQLVNKASLFYELLMKSPTNDRSIGFLIGDIARLMRRHFETALSKAGTGRTVAEARTLAFVRRFPGLRQTALAERLGVEPMTLVGYLDPLEAAGLVERSCDPSDRRAKLVTLTTAATPVMEHIDSALLEVRYRALSGFDGGDVERIHNLLEALQSNLLADDNEGTDA